MIVYAVVILIILVFRLNLDNSLVGNPKYDVETKYLKIVCAILALIAGLRGNSVGADTYAYVCDYENVKNMSFAHVLELSGTIGAGYYWFSKAFSLTGLSVHWWFGVVASFYIYAMYLFIQKYSKDKLVSLLCFFTMGLYTFSLAGLKQTVAMGFMAFSFMSLDDKKYLKAIILGTIAYWCHSATSIFTFGILLYFLRNRQSYYVFLFSFLILVLFVGDWLWQTSIELLSDDHYTELYSHADNIYSAWTFVFYLLLVGFMVFSWRKYNNDRPTEAKLLYGMTMLAVTFQSLATSFSAAFRVAYYFLPFMIVLVPNSCEYFVDYRSKNIWKAILCAICIFWMLYSGRDSVYKFFWQ